MGRKGLTYKDAGVDLDTTDKLKKGIVRKVRSTFTRRVLTDIGLFGGLFDISKLMYKNPVLVSSVDGVGTKLKIAKMMNKHDTVGRDLVAHCVNDIVVQGAKPLFFMNYIGYSKIKDTVYNEIINGLIAGCKKAGCALLGGETAQMPGTYPDGEYDLVGTIVGIVEKNKIIDGSKIEPGDIIIGLPSSGLHTNGYSLVRKICFDVHKLEVTEYIKEFKSTLGEELLKIHTDYSRIILKLLQAFRIKGIAHITGGGFVGNIPRILPKGTKAVIEKKSWKIPPIFQFLQKMGEIRENEMYRSFNMGVGIVMIASRSTAKRILSDLQKDNIEAKIIGQISRGYQKVELL